MHPTSRPFSGPVVSNGRSLCEPACRAWRPASPGLPAGGDILFIEATRVPGSGKLILTGQLGDVMKESAQAALSLIKSKAAGLGIEPSTFEKSDIHIHVPAGAIPKDGPSAGVAMFIALASLVTHRPARSDLAMTGEISLRGLVLPVGGIKEKVVAAVAAGNRDGDAAVEKSQGPRRHSRERARACGVPVDRTCRRGGPDRSASTSAAKLDPPWREQGARVDSEYAKPHTTTRSRRFP